MHRQWRCFHCDEVFFDERCAAKHFGPSEADYAACKIKSHEGHLINYIRKLEEQLAIYRSEDGDIMKSIYTLEADHKQALIRAEEDGYNRGVKDMS